MSVRTKSRKYKHFFGVYLLHSSNPKIKKRTYIGFTVDPEHRLKQHNEGIEFGGAKKTNDRGPWEMILIVHGFPNKPVALTFEWAWQQPFASKRLKNVVENKMSDETNFAFELRVLRVMLNVPPWNRLALNFKWLSKMECWPKICQEYKKALLPHMRDYDIVNVCLKPSDKKKCYFCAPDENDYYTNYMLCLYPNCITSFHTICLANYFTTGQDEIIPKDGICPVCGLKLLWADLLCMSDDFKRT